MGKALTPKQVRKFIENLMELREIPYISGPPAIGKSDVVAQTADDWGLKMIEVTLSQKLPEDLTGLPRLNNSSGKAEYTPFDTFPLEGDPIPDGYHGWLVFLDELSSATEEIFAAIYGLLLGHRIGGRKLHPKALIVAAGNREGDSAIARRLPDTLVTRMFPVEMKSSSKDWLDWASKFPNKNDSIIGFIKKYPDMLLSQLDPLKREELETYNSPRGWGKAFKVMNLHEKRALVKAQKKANSAADITTHQMGETIGPDIASLLFACVGAMPGKCFVDHYNEAMKLPAPWDVAQSPGSTIIPTSTLGRQKLTRDLAEHFVHAQEQSRDALLQYMNRMDGENSEMFVHHLKELFGSTASDRSLIAGICTRLNVLSTKVSGSNGSPFPADSDKNYTPNVF